MLMLHFIGLTMGLGTGFAYAFLGKVISQMAQEEAQKFNHQIKGLSHMGTVGALLLLVSGIYLIIPFWSVLASVPLLILKLVLFVILEFMVLVMSRKALKDYRNNSSDHSKQIAMMGKITLLIGVLIVILAVTIFH